MSRSTGSVRFVLPLVAALLTAPAPTGAQSARVSEEVRTLTTYPFSEPNRVPILTRDRRLYPYHSFEGYTVTAEPRAWRVVKLENDYLEVYVLPEVGGKVWGAVVKATGHEFIYRNEVMKFRNIALRGPWTSGGIELNFGVIGHSPATATPVDFLTRESPDGSVGCIVGSMDLPSRTHWRVEIRLPADRACFETEVLWYNPTPLEQPCYNWMTAAAFARDDLEMYMPGDAYLRHSGEAIPWPFDDEERFLPRYRENDFGGHKSYHVVGELHDFFGGYYHDEDYGFGHWSRYEEMPGQKLWLWALSREGGVWEDLLTDSDGQYVEFQAGRTFVQYSPGGSVNPITQVGFAPLSADRWTETWFPVEGAGGLTDASPRGVLHVSPINGRLDIGVNAFQDTRDTLMVWSGDRLVENRIVGLATLEPFQATVEVTPGETYRVRLPILGLEHRSDPSGRLLSRPFQTDPEAFPALSEANRLVFQADELRQARRYREAGALYRRALTETAWDRGALLGLTELAIRQARYGEARSLVDRLLQLDAYDAEANWLAGVVHRTEGRLADARDAFGWAARSTAFRSAAYAQLAELMIGLEEWAEAARHARRAIEYDRHSVTGWRALAVIGRKAGHPALAGEAREELLTFDPLHHFARAEAWLAAGGAEGDAAEALLGSVGGEYPDQTLLELAVDYTRLGLVEDARSVLGLADTVMPGRGGSWVGGTTAAPVIRAWQAWLRQDASLLEGDVDPAFAFPYRPESLPVMTWAADHGSSWVWRYMLALNLWALDRDQEAAALMADLGAAPDFGPAFAARAHLLEQTRDVDPTPDLRRAVVSDPQDRVLHLLLIRHYQGTGRWDEALATLIRARDRFPGDFDLDLLQAKNLIHTDRAAEATRVLSGSRVLPSENGRESHELWVQAHTLAALQALEGSRPEEARGYLLAGLEWPENLGQGRPFEPEERLLRFLLGVTEQGLGHEEAAREAFQAVATVTSSGVLEDPARPLTRLDLLNLRVLEMLGRTGEARRIREARTAEVDRLRDALSNNLSGSMIQRALAVSERPGRPPRVQGGQ
jgi:tetratricopeptide (TPR) repeat protein